MIKYKTGNEGDIKRSVQQTECTIMSRYANAI